MKQTTNDIHRLHTTPETEGDYSIDYSIGCEVPYCQHWKAVREIANGNEPNALLGYQQRPLYDIVGEPGVFNDFESTEGIDASDWWQWNSGF